MPGKRCPGHPCPVCGVNYGCTWNMSFGVKEDVKCPLGYGTPRTCITHFGKGEGL